MAVVFVVVMMLAGLALAVVGGLLAWRGRHPFVGTFVVVIGLMVVLVAWDTPVSYRRASRSNPLSRPTPSMIHGQPPVPKHAP